MSISRKFQRSKSKYTLSQKIISAVTAAGFIMQPFTAFAGHIVKPSGENLINNGVANIWADKVVDKTAINVFNKFNLSANEIANMYFGTSKENHNAANLVNFVNDRIDINGTVNAIQNSQIGGNLFFLSKEGMAVGKSGVINTGSLYVMTPTAGFMKDIIGADGKTFNEDNFKAQWGENGSGNIAKMQIPVNPSGTITVLGTVNAANDVKMMAAQIGVGKNVSGEIKDENGNVIMKADETNADAYIKTKITNFSDFVNIKNAEADVTAGLEGNLEAQVDQNSGDIVLKAVASTVNSIDENFEKYKGSNNQALATVTVNGTVEARKDAAITAEATNNVSLSEVFDNDTVIESDDNFTEAFGQITKNVATVDINGNVTGQHVDIEANTINNYISGTNEDVDLSVITNLGGMLGPNWDASYAVLANEATVNINKGAVITATAAAEEGKNALNISADSSLKASVGASTAAIKLANFKGTANVPAASVGYAKTDNKAAVNIAGELKSAGDTSIRANADSTVELVSADTSTQLDGQATVINVALAIADGSNSSSVDIKDTAKMTDLNGDLDITATSTNSIDTQALVKAKESAFLGTAVNITDYDSSADVKIDTAIKADSVNIAAGNSVVKNNVVADNNVGSNYLTNLLVSRGTATKTVQNVKNSVSKVKEKILGESKPDIVTALNKLGNWASVGVSVGVVNETNNANVTLTKNAQITAQNSSGTKGDISVTANNYIADTSMSVTGATNNYDKDVSNVALVNAAVLVSDMDSNAAVTLEGGDAHDAKDAEYTQLDGAQISVKANSEFNYGRIDKMIGDLLLLCNKLEGAYASNATYKQNVEDLKTKAEEFKQNCAADPGYADSTEGNEAALALAAAAQQVSLDASDASVAEQIKDIFVGPLSVVGAAAQFANPNNYANFQAGASTGGKKDDAAKVAVSGAVNLNYITNNANVIVGKNTEITGSGKVDINAGAAQADVAFNGKLGITGGADNAAGGTVGVHYAEVNSMVAIAEGAEVTGSAINIGAENDVAHTAITFGAGKSEGNALAGMGSYLEGDSNSIVSVDDEASLTATGRNEYKEDEEKPVPDDITGISDGSVNITAYNNTVLTNIAGGGAIGGENAAIGASVAITDYDVYNMAGIVNNDAGVAAAAGEAPEDETEEQKRDRVQQENIAKLQELTKKQSGLNDAEYEKLFGSAERTVAGAGINAHDVNVDVLTDGVINTVTIAGSAVTGSDFDEPGIGDKLGNFVSNMKNRVENGIDKLDMAVQNKYNGTMESPDLKPTDMQASNPNVGQQRPSFSISGAGSSSVNLIDGASTALLDGVKITLANDNAGNAGKLNVSATDSSFIGAWSGAAAISWKTFMTGQNWENKSVGFAGSVGVNMVNTDAASIIRGSTINNAGSITNTADKSGALVAAGLGMAVEKSGETGSGGENYGGAASVSVNIAENDIYAVMQGNNVNTDEDTNKTVLTNNAYDNDVQVTGGINASIAKGGQQGVAVGGTVTYGELTNNVQSAIVGGEYKNMGTVDVSAVTDITQVSAAVGVAAATGSEKNYGIDGVAAYNQLNNNADAVIDGAAITADKVNAAAYDTDLGENRHTEYINQRGLDATGDTYLKNISDTSEDLYEKNDDGSIKLDENGEPVLKVGKTGNTIVTGALGITATTGDGGASGSAAISISDINNDFNASIKNNSIIKTNGMPAEKADNTADVNVLAKSDTLLVNIAAGAGGASKGFAGAGSFGWSTINNDNTASIENSSIDAASTKVNAISGTLGVNVAGQVSVGKQAVGLAVAYNDLENNTGAYVLGSDIKNTSTDAEGKEVSEETDVKVAAENSGKMYAIGAGVGVAASSGSQVAANGTVAINRGNNNLEAIIGDYVSSNGTNHTRIANAKNIDVTSNDSASVLSVAGGVGISRKVAVGGSIAYNEIGNISGNADGKKQNNTAQINNAFITTADEAKIIVQALDNAKLTTAAVGVGIAAGGSVAVQGAAATALINKDTEASMNGVTVSKASEQDNSGADVDVKASSSNDIVTTADVVSVAAGGGTAVAVGAGVSVNRSEAGVNAFVSGGSMKIDDLAVEAANSANITTVGIGGSVAGGTGAGVTGSVAVNMIGNNTTAKIDGGADITADNNVVVDARSDEQIANYAGNASVAATGAAVGLSVSVNQIDGTTNASIEGSGTQVNAAGNYEDAELNNTVGNDEEDYILDDFVNEKTFQSQENLGDKRTGKTYSGVAVSASSTHSIKSFLINAGVAAQGAAVNGTVNVNQTDGSTTAAIKDAAINQNGFTGDVNVIAHDYSNSAGIVGSAGVAGEGAGIGLGADTNTLSRDVTAEISGTENNKNNVKGNAVNVEAEAKQGVSSMAIGVGGAGIGAGVANGTTVTLVDGKTIAKINGSNITAGSLNVTAKHLDRINTNGISIGVGGLGAGIGIGVAVLNENSTTEATVKNTDVTYTNADGETVINADNTTVMNYQLYNVGGAIAGVAGSVGVANVNSKVNANVVGSDFGADDSETNKAGSIAVGAANDIDFDQTAGTAGAGAVGVGVGVSVNTIDSQVQAKVEDSHLYANGNIDVTAEETRNVDQLAVNAGAGGIAAGANVMVTNVGKEVSNAYGTDGMDEVNVEQAYQEAQNAINGGKLTSDYTLGALNDTEAGNASGNAVPGKGGQQDSIVKVDIDGATLKTDGNISAEAHETTNVNMEGINAQLAAGGSAAGTVGILNVYRNSGVEITSAELDAADVDIKAIQSGLSKLNIYQGAGAVGGAIGAAYGSINSEGKSGVGIGNSTITSDEDVDITANDESRTEVNAIGVSISGGYSASVIVAEGTNKAETTVTVDETNMNADNDINIHAERQAKDENGNTVDGKGNQYNSLSVSAIAASGGLMFAGTGVGATANEYGTVGVEVNGSDFTAGNDISITALNAPSVKAVTGAVAGSMVASGAITVAEANIGGAGEDEHLKTYVRLNDESSDESGEESGKESSEAENRKNSFTADSLTAEATVDAQQTADMNGISVSAALWPTGSVQVNVGGADIYSDVEVSVGENLFKGNSDTDGIDLTISGSNSVTQNVSAKGIAVSTFVASGSNAAESNAELNTDVTVAGSSQESEVHDLTVRAESNADITATADGTGGGLVGVSPNAASVDNDYIANTSVNIGGNWNTAGAVEATAINGGDINLLSDALQAAVVGGSGVWLDNNIDNQADVNITDAEINSEGRQSYTAQNIADYDGDIKGSGYGGVTITGTQLEDTFNYSANVNIENAELHATGDEGSITAQALTEGNISSYNILKSAGVIPVSVADSEHTTTYNNAVNINGSRLITDKKNQDITLAASDNTRVDLNTTADTQGGFAGAATADAVNNFNRYNAVNIVTLKNKDGVEQQSYLESANDVNLYAGVDANGKYSSLNLDIIADAYNRTLLPLSTNPTVDNNMSQNNTVTIDDDVASVRHINAKAVKGNTTIGKSATVYKNIGGGGKGSVTTTIGGNDEGTDEVYNNGITADGNLIAGIHNKLDITITGTTETNIVYKDADGNVDEEKSGVSYDEITVNAAQEWFDESTIAPTEVTIVNNLKEEYNQLASILNQYPKGTTERTNIEEAMTALQGQMDALGFVIEDKEGNAFGEPLSEKTVLGIELPDIVVSGGNINFETDSLSGKGSITAQGAPQVDINIDSDLYLKVNDITIQDNGGIVRLNGSQVNGALEGFVGTVSTPGTGTEAATPAINITSTSDSALSYKETNTLAQPDIAIFGDIVNAVGNINISSQSNDITINENAQLSARNITLSAANGSVTQNSTEGIYNVAGDPVSQYQFSVDAATKIQAYVDGKLREDHNWSISFSSRDAYINWLKTEVGVTDEELGNTQISESAGIVAGNNVYINALDANINGLVQAGYGDYLVDLGDDEITNINNLINTYKGKNFTDSEVLGNSDFLITKGDKVWDSTDKVWDYEIAVYYNPTTKKFLVDNVNPNGGQIYINGAVSSTGNGRLMAMDGTANIDIDTTAIADNVSGVVINNITNNDIQGLISITDTNTNKVTEIRNGEWRQYEVGTAVQDRPAWTTGSLNEYKPEEGLSYQYTGGYKSGQIYYKYYIKDFLFWTGLKYDQSTTNIEQAIEKEGGTADIKIDSSESTSGTPNGNGAFIGTRDEQDNNSIWSISGSYVESGENSVSEAHPGEPVYGPPEWLGYIGGYGTIKYTWTTETSTTSSTTSSIKADIPIQIGFLGNGNKSGDINVNSNQNIELAGNISNAEVNGAGKGSVTLTSETGSVSAIGSANINSDDVNIKAATGVDVNHAAIGNTANINVATDSGDISFVSGAGSLNIEQMITGITYNKEDGTIDNTDNIDASTGSVYLEAQGNILDAAQGDYAVKGQRIDLVSHTGNIGALDDKGNIVNALRVLGGSELYSSDAMASSVNAQANGDIVLTQTSGNMRLGTIVSENGDAVLTVTNGSFVDAHPGENNDNSSAQNKIDRWLEAGLIANEADDQNAKAAQQAKEERLAGLEMQMNSLAYENGEVNADKVKSYKDAANEFNTAIKDAKAEYQAALSAEGANDTTIKAAYEKYQTAQQEFFNSKNFTKAEQSVITNYAEVSSSENYGWSKNQLLYAIQNSVINSYPGEVQSVKTPNVKANNITLNAAKGGIGIDGEAKVIDYVNLNKVDNLKLLAQAKAGDISWDKKNQQVTIRQQQAITVQVKQEGGKVDVTGKDNVYLAGVQGTELNVNGITTTGDIRLQGDEGVIVDGTLKGHDLTIAGGSGSIMGAGSDDYVDTNISGTLDANAGKNIYISETGDLNILTLAAGNIADIKATGNILMSDVAGSTAQGYINAQTLNLTATGGSIGTNVNAIRIADNGVVINASATDDIVLAGVTGNPSAGSIVLGTISGASLDVESVSNVSLGRVDDTETTDKEETVASSITTTGDAAIEAARDINLVNGTANIGNSADNSFTLTANGGSITQSAAHSITANNVNASAAKNISLASKGNKVNSFVVNGLGAYNSLNGSVELAGSKDSGFTADLNGITVNNGGVTVTNYAENGTLNISGDSVKTTDAEKGSVTFSSEGSITSDATVNSAANINMNADGAIDNDGSMTAQNNVNVDTTAGAIELGGSVTANTGTVTVHSDKGAIHIGDDNGNGTVNAGTDVSITTNEGNITTTGAVSGGNNVKVDAGTKGNIELGGIVNAEGGNVDVDTQSGDVTTKGEVTGKIDVTINSDDGDVTIGGKVQSETGSTHINAGTEEEPGITEDKDGNVTVNGEVASGKEVIVNANNGSITVIGNTTASDGNVQTTVKGNGNISLEGSVNASGNVKAEVTGTGDITTSDNAEVNSTDIEFTANKGNITTGSSLTAKENVDLNTNTGDITFGGDVTASDGNITININEAGNLKDVLNTENTLSAFSQDGDDAKGNIYINIKGIGDVDLSEIYADNDARLDIANGNLALGTINGELVAIQLRTEDKDMNVGEIIAGTQIVLTGSDMTLDQIAQRPDADGMLVITPDNAEADKPIDNFTIGDIKTNAGSGIRFDRLWVNNSDIHISEGQLWFDKLYVEDNAHFSNDEMTAAIYGKPPLRDGSDSVYWINTEENRPESSLDMWLNGTGDWMYLRFTDDHIQESNGILLTLDEYDYVYDQRFTAENHLRWQHGRYLDEDWKEAYGYGLSLHNRYGLIDYQEFTETNAGADEVAVEA